MRACWLADPHRPWQALCSIATQARRHCVALAAADGHSCLQVKVICNSGGQFVRMEGGAIEYQGGETRLVSVRSSCTFKELMASLERVMAYQRRSGSSDAGRVGHCPCTGCSGRRGRRIIC